MNSFLRFVSCLSMLLAGLVLVSTAPAAADTVLEAGQALPLSGYAAHVVDETRGRIYITAGPGDDRLAVTDLQGRPIQTVDGLTGASSMALTDDGASLFVALETHRVVRLDADTLTVEQSYDLPDFRQVIDLAWAGGRLWVAAGADCCTSTLYSFDPTTGERTPFTGPQGEGPALTSTTDGRLLVLMRSTRTLSLVDPSSGAVVATREFGEYLRDVRTSSNGRPYVLTDRSVGWNDLVSLDPATLETFRTTQVTSNSAVDTNGSIVVSSTGDGWYDARGVDARDADTSSRINRFRVPGGPGEYPVVLATVLTSAGMVVIHLDTETVVASYVSDPSVQSSTVTLQIPPDAFIGREANLTGTLTDHGAPIAGAAVRIDDEPGGSDPGQPIRTRVVTTADDGTFSFPYTPRTWNDLITLEYAGDGTHPAAWQEVHGDFNQQPTHLSLDYPTTPAPGEAITITGALTALGDPVPGAEIKVDHWCSDTPPATVRTDETGQFDLTVTPGRCEADQFSFYYPGTSTYEYLSATRVVQPTWRTSKVTLVQPAEAALAGSTWVWEGTIESAGSAAPDVPITYTLRRYSTGTLVASGATRTDTSGGFSITETIEGADRYTLVARYDGDDTTLGSSGTDEFQVARIPTRLSVDDSDMEVLPDQAITIGGRVTTSDGAPLADHPIEISHGSVITPLRTDADGRFEFQTVPRPPESSSDSLRLYGVHVVETPRYAGVNWTVRVTVAPEPTRLVLDSVPSRSAPGDEITLAGRLVTRSGEPLAGWDILLSHSDGEPRTLHAVTDEQGRFSVDTVIHTGYWQYVTASFAGTRLLASSNGYANWESTPLPGVLTLDKVPTRLLGESISLTGRLTDVDGNGESSWIRISRIDETGQPDWSYGQIRTATDGSFSMDVPADQIGRYTFTARSELWRVAPQSDSIVVDVRRLQLTTTALRADAVKQGWSVFDADRDPLVRTSTNPARGGLCVAHQLQRLVDGTWQPVTTPRCKDTSDAGTLSQRIGVRHPAGSRFRVRAIRDSQIQTVGDWVKVRFQ